jgi:cytosine/adenosine deaminase-related metal-dependent hydrolase
MIAGKVMMDRNCPEFLRDTAESAYEHSKALIERWHGTDRLLAATPLMARRMANAADIVERLFVLMMLGDDRAVLATHVMGRRASARSPR